MEISNLLKKREKNGLLPLDEFMKLKDSDIKDGKNDKFWLSFDDARVMFREYSSDEEALSELLCSKMCNKLGIATIKCDYARFKDSKGIILYDKLYKSNEIVIDALTFCIRYHEDLKSKAIKKNLNNLNVLLDINIEYNNFGSLSKLFDLRFPGNSADLKNTLLKIYIIDTLFDNHDRNLWTLKIISDEYGNHPDLISVGSNGVFRLDKGIDYIKNALKDIKDNKNKIERYYSASEDKKTLKYKNRDEDSLMELANYYVYMNDDDKNNIIHFVNNIDVDDVLKDLILIRDIDKDVLEWIKLFFNERKSFLLNSLSKINEKSIKNEKNKLINFKRKY